MRSEWDNVVKKSPFDANYGKYVEQLLTYIVNSIEAYGSHDFDDLRLRILPRSIDLDEIKDRNVSQMTVYNTLPPMFGTENCDNRDVKRIIGLSIMKHDLYCQVYRPADEELKTHRLSKVVTDAETLVRICDCVWRTVETL